MKITATAYKLPFFTENGFVRKKCKICKANFWTQNSDLDDCGDAPCHPYTFLGNPPTKRPFHLEEMREAFLAFFEKNGHTRIKPYPVVARWREDLFVTIASIADFQPFVTEGIIQPPANPLVISQPCLRFNDVDNVGLTGGRHFTIFEMGGAHAFNYPDKQVYWKNETVRFHHEFVVDVLGVKSDAVTYKEGLWSGGGNAGPDVEGCIGGLEVSTLVFMQYKVVGDKLIDMPIKIVDTGYGMERFTWLSQGSPSGFHAIYGKILEKILRLSKIPPIDERIIMESTRYSALMNVETLSDKMTLRKKIAKPLGINHVELDEIMTPIENAYGVADHTKALVFLLAEGVVPSNVRAGYLTRLLIRRTYRLLRALGIENKLSEIVEMQIECWSPTFRNIEEMRKEILDAISVEEKKYRDTLKRGMVLSRKIAVEVKSKGKNEIPVDNLVELYDSHGISPEIVEEAVKSDGIKVSIPDNFYAMIAQRHIAPPTTLEEKTGTRELEQDISGVPSTFALYYDSPYVRTFEAKVLKVIDGKYVVLDKTYFYPESGGQDADQGYLKEESRQIRVVDVFKIGNVVVHVVDGVAPTEEKVVIGEVDWDRRISLMRHHTSTHIVLGAARCVLGQHVWQAGAEKEVEKSRLDISHWRRITPQQTHEIERLSNETIMANIPVEVAWISRGEAEEKYGYRLYQGGVVPGERIRVVQIGDWDVEACGGTHVKATGEIGFLKILRIERIQDGVERIVFVSGSNAVKYAQKIEDGMKEIAAILELPLERVVNAVEERCEELKRLKREVTKLRVNGSANATTTMLNQAKKIGELLLATQVSSKINAESMIKILDTLTKKEPKAVGVMWEVDKTVRFVVMAGDIAIKQGINSGIIASKIANVLGGGGGGRPNLGQGGGINVEKVEESLKIVEAVMRQQIGGKTVVS
ncbi:MAG: alanine--tRNA ligase [Candidatus Bathyarchaeota archaeon]